jgi:hypothetical protein
MGTGPLWIVGAVCFGTFTVALRFALQMMDDGRYRDSSRWFFLSFVPLGIISLLWSASEAIPMGTRNWVLGVVGGAIGASGIIWAGYLCQTVPAQAESRTDVPATAVAQAVTSREALASALDDLANAVMAAPSVVIGSQVTVEAGKGSSGTIIGKQITVTAGTGSTGTVIGEQITVGSNNATPVNGQRAHDLRENANVVRSGQGSKAAIGAAINQARLPGPQNAGLDAAINRAAQSLQESDLR